MNWALKACFRLQHSARDMVGDCRAIAATEFAVIVPIMLVMFFGTVEFSSAVAVDRKVTLMARTLSDLTAQSPPAGIADADFVNYFSASVAIMTPYAADPTEATLSEIYIDSKKVAKITWSTAATMPTGALQAKLAASTRSPGDTVTPMIPDALLIPQTYLILGEVTYLYQPTIGYVMAKAGVNLSDVAYTRPRQNTCVIYTTKSLPPNGLCPLN